MTNYKPGKIASKVLEELSAEYLRMWSLTERDPSIVNMLYSTSIKAIEKMRSDASYYTTSYKMKNENLDTHFEIESDDLFKINECQSKLNSVHNYDNELDGYLNIFQFPDNIESAVRRFDGSSDKLPDRRPVISTVFDLINFIYINKLAKDSLLKETPLYSVENDMCEALLNTDFNLNINDLELPYERFVLEIPGNINCIFIAKKICKSFMLVDIYPVGWAGDFTSCQFIFTYNIIYTKTNKSLRLQLSDDYSGIVWRCKNSFKNFKELCAENKNSKIMAGCEKNRALRESFHLSLTEDGIDKITKNINHYISRIESALHVGFNTLAYLTTPKADIEEKLIKTETPYLTGNGKTGKKKKLVTRYKMNESPIIMVGSNIRNPIKTKSGCSGNGTKWKVRTLIPGCWQRRRYGSMKLEDRPLRNVWVRAHWRGPEDAPISKRARLIISPDSKQ